MEREAVKDSDDVRVSLDKGAEAAAPTVRPVRRWALGPSVVVGWVAAVGGAVAVVGFMAGWLFLTDLDLRYAIVMRCLGVLAALTALVMFCSVVAGKVGLSDTYAYAVRRAGRSGGGAGGVQTGTVPPLPERLPGGWFSRCRRAAFCVCLGTVAVGWWALAVGGREVKPEVEWMDVDGSAVVRTVPIREVREMEFHDFDEGYYTGRVTVSLPTRYGDQEADVDVTSDARPGVGDRISVLYSMEAPSRGVFSGDAAELREALAGESFTPAERWTVFGCWLLVSGGMLAVLRYESRPGPWRRRIDPGGRALRGTVVGGSTWSSDEGQAEGRKASGVHHCLTMDTEAGRVTFLVDSAAGAELAEALGRADVWLYWDRRGSTDLFASGVLVGDDGWCLHGRLPVAGLKAVAVDARSAEAFMGAGRRVRTLDPRAAWPARANRGMLTLSVIGLFFALLLVQDGDWDLDSGKRWFVAFFATLMVWGFYGLCLRAIKPPPTRRPTPPPVRPEGGAEGETRTGC
ncbi:hypothetical protein [Streptomyces sp. KR80]|uniref:hypothetical protein n=1 Tax=Streptomyces sp. KR80 TaxID=3457426 RepID=UPI003FD32E72